MSQSGAESFLGLCLSSLSISVEGLPRTTVISTGQHILIEGEDEDNPYVARVIRLFGDGESRRRSRK
ncbi:origin recognition complex subunit 1-like isoform X1 [Lates japonicus]|uniref:Origin recognition complex subunit 1-like isoform X1 n=1 Tax=Lates japonicus TaxID=270547 RepID=A0AAD3NBF6_LATJO|nr:origin recognition complex subunit 1-like isoform X1 [Lates japonicus]